MKHVKKFKLEAISLVEDQSREITKVAQNLSYKNGYRNTAKKHKVNH